MIGESRSALCPQEVVRPIRFIPSNHQARGPYLMAKVVPHLRATSQTEIEDEGYPTHVVCAWLGNSRRVATAHYLQVTDAHFERATAPHAV
jgi:hypothetical protein